MALVLRVSVFLLTLAAPVLGGRGLRGRMASWPWAQKDAEIARRSLVELAEKFTHSDGSSRLDEMEKAMSTMFAALPKDEEGMLTHDVVRYALHRLFVHRHSWYVRGLDAGSERAAQASSLNSKGVVDFDLNSIPVLPTLLQKSVEEYHHSKGLTLRELAALAASVEDLAHREAVYHLDQAYAATNTAKDATLSADEVETIIDTYFTMYMLGNNFTDWSNQTILKRRNTFMSSRRWRELGGWLTEHLGNESQKLFTDEDVSLNYTEVVRITESVGDHFGKYNDLECKDMKRELLTMEGRKPGRVRLSDFYNRSKSGVWYFAEKVDYLRTLGALDETNVSDPLVIVPNYVTSPPQCLRASSVYHVCCPNECESLMLELEGAVGAPDANPKTLERLVAGLSSDTVRPRDELPPNLKRRLQEIGDFGGSRVKLHSRKFALWMHHAFPNECPFPHKEGTTSPLTPDEWVLSAGEASHVASDAEMNDHIRPDETCSPDGASDEASELPWPDDELEWIASTGTGVQSEQGAQSLRSVTPWLTCLAVVVWFILRSRKATRGKNGALPLF